MHAIASSPSELHDEVRAQVAKPRAMKFIVSFDENREAEGTQNNAAVRSFT